MIKEIRMALHHELYIPALASALTLPDICGRAEYPKENVGNRYTRWLQVYAESRKFGEYRTCSIDGLRAKDVYKLRCEFLHQGSSEINTLEYFELVTFNPHSANQFQFFSEIQLCGNDNKSASRKVSVNIVMLCEWLCDSAETYYVANKEKFGFINFKLVNTDYHTAKIFGIKTRNIYDDSNELM